MKNVPRNKFAFGSRRRKRRTSFSQAHEKSIFDLLLNIETRIRSKMTKKSSLGGHNPAALAGTPIRVVSGSTSRYVE
jgi:hypothetical protein